MVRASYPRLTRLLLALLSIGFVAGCANPDSTQPPEAAVAQHAFFLKHLENVDRIEFVLDKDSEGPQEGYVRYGRVLVEDAATIESIVSLLKKASDLQVNPNRYGRPLSGYEVRLTLIVKKPLQVYRCRLVTATVLALDDTEAFNLFLPDDRLVERLTEVAKEYAKDNPNDVLESNP